MSRRTLEGIESRMFRLLAFTVCAAVLGTWLEQRHVLRSKRLVADVVRPVAQAFEAL